MSSWMSSWSTSPSDRRARSGDMPIDHLHDALRQVRYEEEADERAPELPASYGLDRLVLLVKEPETIACYWELAGEAIERAHAELADAELRGARLLLRMLVTEPDGSHAVERERRDLQPFRAGERAMYFSVAPGTACRAEIGIATTGGRYLPVIASNNVQSPRRP